MLRALCGVFLSAVIISPAAAFHAHHARPVYRLGVFEVTDTASHEIPLDDAGTTSVSLNSSGNNVGVLLTYNADCMSQGPAGSYVSISILADGTPVKPQSGTAFVFCATGAQPAFTAVTRTAFWFPKTTGTHTLKVIGTGINTTDWEVKSTMFTIQPYLPYS
jgi:hypothetical protein